MCCLLPRKCHKSEGSLDDPANIFNCSPFSGDFSSHFLQWIKQFYDSKVWFIFLQNADFHISANSWLCWVLRFNLHTLECLMFAETERVESVNTNFKCSSLMGFDSYGSSRSSVFVWIWYLKFYFLHKKNCAASVHVRRETRLSSDWWQKFIIDFSICFSHADKLQNEASIESRERRFVEISIKLFLLDLT